MDALTPITPAGWWGLTAVALLGLELFMPGVFLIWIGIAAAAMAILLLAVDLPIAWQLVLFAAFAVASVFVGLRVMRARGGQADQGELKAPEAQMIGRRGTVTEALRGGRGKVKVGDTLWLAEGPDLDVGTDIRVIGQHVTALVVERVAP
jgi:membrane protein implicated in regulation of membrane protease activity